MKLWKTPGTKTAWYVALTLVLLLAGYSSAYAAATPPMVGDTAPDFTLNSQEGRPVIVHQRRTAAVTVASPVGAPRWPRRGLHRANLWAGPGPSVDVRRRNAGESARFSW